MTFQVGSQRVAGIWGAHLLFKGRQTATAPSQPPEQQLFRDLQVEGPGCWNWQHCGKVMFAKDRGCPLLRSAKFLEDAAFCPPVIIKSCLPKDWLHLPQRGPGAATGTDPLIEEETSFKRENCVFSCLQCLGVRSKFFVPILQCATTIWFWTVLLLGGVMPQVLHLYNGNNNFAELIVGVDRFLGLLNTASGVPFYSRLQVARLVH